MHDSLNRWTKRCCFNIADERLPYARSGRGLELGGLGSAVLEFYSLNNKQGVSVRIMGVPDVFVEHGSIKEQRQEVGLTAERVATELKALLPRIRKRVNGPA